MTKKTNNKYLQTQTISSQRKFGIRNEREIPNDDKALMTISFKDFQFNNQNPPGQNLEDWQKDKILSYLIEKLKYICQLNRIEATQKEFIKEYKNFPSNSEFKNPFPESDLSWAVINKVGGQKARVAGYLNENVFYVVFLDKNHLFFPTKKK